MGTNYYLHLGKRSAVVGDLPGRFTIAAGLEAVLASVPGTAPVIQDEDGHRLTVAEFMARIANDIRDPGQIWTEFS